MTRLRPLCLLLTAAALQAQRPDSLRPRVQAYVREHDAALLREFSDFLAVPNVSADTAGIRRNAALLLSMLAQRGVQARLLEHPGASPVVYGELLTPGDARTVGLYAHDGGHAGEPAD